MPGDSASSTTTTDEGLARVASTTRALPLRPVDKCEGSYEQAPAVGKQIDVGSETGASPHRVIKDQTTEQRQMSTLSNVPSYAELEKLKNRSGMSSQGARSGTFIANGTISQSSRDSGQALVTAGKKRGLVRETTNGSSASLQPSQSSVPNVASHGSESSPVPKHPANLPANGPAESLHVRKPPSHLQKKEVTRKERSTSIPVPATIEVKSFDGTTLAHGFRSTESRANQKYHALLVPRALPVPTNPPAPSKPKLAKPTAMRRGKWTAEEEAYVARVIQDFNSGFLNAPAGTTLRSYLSEKLHCDPMRITKKFTGDACIGKRVFHPAVRCPSNAGAIDKAQTELDALERRWRRRMEMQQRESAKKAAASAAAAAAAAVIGRSSYEQQQPLAPHSKKTAVTRTASWLAEANSIFKRQQPTQNADDASKSTQSMARQEIESQMEEVQRLIHEGPIIQQAAAGLPHLLECNTSGRPHSPDTPSRQADKRPRRIDESGAADAEALLGFLNSVRAQEAANTVTNGS